MALKHTLKGVKVSDDGVLIQAYFVLHTESQASCFIIKEKSENGGLDGHSITTTG